VRCFIYLFIYLFNNPISAFHGLPHRFSDDAVEVLEARNVGCSSWCGDGLLVVSHDVDDLGTKTSLDVRVVRQQVHEKTVRVGCLSNSTSLPSSLSLNVASSNLVNYTSSRKQMIL